MICWKCAKDKPDDEFVGYKGSPRKHCSICAQYWSTYKKANPEKSRKYAQTWRKQHREKHLAGHRSNYQANRLKILEVARLYRETHQEKILELTRAREAKHPGVRMRQIRDWAKSHPERRRAAVYKWKETHPELTQAQDRNNRARRRGAAGQHTAADIQWLYQQQGGRCEACRKKLITKGREKYHVDHMQPLSRGGRNDLSNLQLLCPSCNGRKHAMPYEEWCSQLGRLPLAVREAC